MNARTSMLLCVASLLCLSAGRTQAAPPPSGPGSVRVLVAYYSLTGNTEKMADGVVEGVKRVSGAAVVKKKVEEVAKEDLETADGIILGCPTYYGTLPGKMKVVIDAKLKRAGNQSQENP